MSTPPAVIRVTQEHITKGVMGDIFRCPVALALCEQGGYEPGDLTVNYSEIVAPLGDRDIAAGLPAEAAEFIGLFDDGESVQPFEFRLDWGTS